MIVSSTALASAPFRLGGCWSCRPGIRVGFFVAIDATSLLAFLQDAVLVEKRYRGPPKGNCMALSTGPSSRGNVPDGNGKLRALWKRRDLYW